MKELKQGAIDLSVASAPKEKAQKPFYCLGYGSSLFYFYVPEIDKVLKFKTKHLTPPKIYELAPLEWWQKHYHTTDRRCQSQVRWSDVAPVLMGSCIAEGQFLGLPHFINKKFGVKL